MLGAVFRALIYGVVRCALRLRWTLANTLIMDALNGGASSNVAEARKIFENLIPTVRRVYGIAHPFTKGVEDEYEQLASRLGEFG